MKLQLDEDFTIDQVPNAKYGWRDKVIAKVATMENGEELLNKGVQRMECTKEQNITALEKRMKNVEIDIKHLDKDIEIGRAHV